MGKLVAFKRIAKAPLPPAIVVPTDPVKAYAAGQKMGADLASGKVKLEDLGIPPKSSNVFTSETSTPPSSATLVVGPGHGISATSTSVALPKPVPPVTTPTDPKVGMVLYKESDTGVGFKRWAVWLEWTNRWTVWTEWGHEKKHQARKQMSFMNESRAKAYMQSCIASKIKRGYRRTK